MTATCARLAASATSVKSLRNESVEGVCRAFCGGGGAGTEAIWLGEVRMEEAFVEALPPCDGEEMGAFIFSLCVCIEDAKAKRWKKEDAKIGVCRLGVAPEYERREKTGVVRPAADVEMRPKIPTRVRCKKR